MYYEEYTTRVSDRCHRSNYSNPTGEVFASSEREGDRPPGIPPGERGDSVMELHADPINSVAVGVIGLGNRGLGMTSTLSDLTKIQHLIVKG